MEKREKASVDVKGAYLLRREKNGWCLLVKIDPNYANYRLLDGSVAVMLDKALYGCESRPDCFITILANLIIEE